MLLGVDAEKWNIEFSHFSDCVFWAFSVRFLCRMQHFVLGTSLVDGYTVLASLMSDDMISCTALARLFMRYGMMRIKCVV